MNTWFWVTDHMNKEKEGILSDFWHDLLPQILAVIKPTIFFFSFWEGRAGGRGRGGLTWIFSSGLQRDCDHEFWLKIGEGQSSLEKGLKLLHSHFKVFERRKKTNLLDLLWICCWGLRIKCDGYLCCKL